jgi:HEAT repeat protein
MSMEALFAAGPMAFAEDWRPEESGRLAPSVMSFLDSPRHEQHARAIEALGKLAWPASEGAIRRSLEDPMPACRAEAALALFRFQYMPTVWGEPFAKLSEESVQALCRASRDAEPEVRWSVAYSFSRFGAPRAIPALERLLHDEDRWCRAFAARALGRSDAESSLDALAKTAAHPDPILRGEAVRALGNLAATDRIPEAVLSDPSVHVRTLAAEAIGKAKARDPRLGRLLGDSSPMVRAEAAAALKPEEFEKHRDLLHDPHWHVRVRAARSAP